MRHLFLLFAFLSAWARAEERLIQVPQGSDLAGSAFQVRSSNRRDGTVDFTIHISPQPGSSPADLLPHARIGFFYWDHGNKITHTRDLTPRVQPDRSLVYTFAVNPGWLIGYSLCFVYTPPTPTPVTDETSYHFSLLLYTEDGPNPRESYAALRAFQKTPTYLSNGATPDYLVDLNGDGHRERIVNFGFRAHQDNRSIFTLRHRHWRFIGYIDLGETLHVLPKTRAGWHDFSVDRELARSQVVREFYRWNVREKLYEMHGSRQLHPADSIDGLGAHHPPASLFSKAGWEGVWLKD